MKLKPLADRVVVISIENDEVIKGGIVLPTTAKEKPQMAEVISGWARRHCGWQGSRDARQTRRQSDLLEVRGHRSQAGRQRIHDRSSERYPRCC